MPTDDRSRRTSPSHRILLATALLLTAVGGVYVGAKATCFMVASSQSEYGLPDVLDFRFFWIAGQLWLDGQDPYDVALFGEAHDALVDQLVEAGDGDIVRFDDFAPVWAYPPWWAPVAMLFGALPFRAAELLWQVMNVGLLIGSIVLTVKLLRAQKAINRWDARLWFGVAYFLLLQAVPQVIFLGQTSLLAVFGLVLALDSLHQRRMVPAVAGLYLLALKPQFALIVLVALLVRGHFRLITGVALVLLAASGPAFFSSGLVTNISGFLTNLGLYSETIFNQPDTLIGLVHLVDRYAGIQWPSVAYLLFGGAAGAAVGILTRRGRFDWWGDTDAEADPALLILMVGLISALMRLHSYDLVLYGPAAMLALFLPWRRGVWLLPGFLLAWRPGTIIKLLSLLGVSRIGDLAPANLLFSIATLLVVAGSAKIAFDSLRDHVQPGSPAKN